MSIKFRMYQDNRKNSKRKGYWYARAVSPDLVSVKDLALRISERCTVTEPDILAVISALVFEMNQVLKDGNRVKLDGLGTFRVGIHSQGVQKAEDFNAQRYLRCACAFRANGDYRCDEASCEDPHQRFAYSGGCAV